MGLSNKKSKTNETSQTQQNVTTTRTNPAFVEDAIKGFTGKVGGLLDRNPLDFVAGADPLQTQAASSAAGLGGWRAGLSRAGEIANQAAGATTAPASLLDNLDDYMSPYREDVVDTTLADMDVDAGRTRAAQAAAGARNAAFGGSRFGVREAQTEGELSRARSAADAQLRDTMFNTGARLSSEDAGRRQQAALADADRRLSAGGLMGQLADLEASGARGDIATQMAAGGALRDIEGEKRQSQLGLLGAVGDLLGKGQFDLFSGQNTNGVTNSTGTSTTTSSGGLLSQIGQAIQIASSAAAMSDLRVKRDVTSLGYDDRGRRWVSWRYLWDGDDVEPHVGLIAQDTLATDPAAVLEGPDGFLRIDYSKVEAPTWLHS